MSGEIIKYESGGNEIVLSPQIVRDYLVSGNGNITDQEIQMFLQLCKYQKLNPFLREVYLIKYGTSPATMVTGKETFLKRANHNVLYRGHKTGMSADGKQAWAEVYKEGYAIPIRVEVDWSEYIGRKSDGSVTKMWSDKPRTMLKKVALVQALREAFPDDFGGLYSQEEINSIKDELPDGKVVIPEQTAPAKPDSFSDIIDKKNAAEAEFDEDTGEVSQPPDMPEPPDESYDDAPLACYDIPSPQQAQDDNSPDGLRLKLDTLAAQISSTHPDYKTKQEVIRQCTEWTNKQGEYIPGKTNVKYISDKAVVVAYGKAKEIAEGKVKNKPVEKQQQQYDDDLPF